MHVLHINLERRWGGGERQVMFLMQGLNRLGHTNCLMTRADSPLRTRAKELGLKVFGIRKPFLRHGYTLKKYDLIHVHENRGLLLAAFWKAWHGRPFLSTRRTMFIPGHHILTRWKYKQPDKIVTISNNIATMLKDWGVPARKIHTIPSAIPLEDRSELKRVKELKAHYADWTIIGNIASLVEAKDHMTLLEAAKYVSEKKHVLFLILGDGPLKTQLRKRIKELNLTNVQLLGHQEDPYSFFKIFDYFIMTSRQEGLCSSILDAFYYQVPVIATKTGGIPEIVKHKKTGLLAEPQSPKEISDSILDMIDNKELKHFCVKNAFNMLQDKHSIESMALSYEQIYKEIKR
jgi:glycosyltransferase involved in cell wall biosynthesis